MVFNSKLIVTYTKSATTCFNYTYSTISFVASINHNYTFNNNCHFIRKQYNFMHTSVNTIYKNCVKK